MGYFSTCGASKADIVKEITQDSPRHQASDWSNAEQKIVQLDYEVESKTLTKRVISSVLWTVQEVTRHYPGQAPKSERFIGCYLLSKHRDGDWGYKPMDESVHPYYFSCPLAYLGMVPEQNKEWREKVREWHNKQNRKLEVGKSYFLNGCRIPEVCISSLKPLRGIYNGHLFRLKKDLIGDLCST